MDKSFDEAVKNINYKRIMDKVCSKYSAFMDPDELTSIRLNTLWECFKKYDPTRGAKFTSYLYNSIKWECQKELYVINKSRKGLDYNDDLYSCCDQNHVDIFDAIETLPPNLQIAVKQRFFQGFTMEERGKTNNYSRETARRYVKKGVEKLKEICKLT